jgi:hypothetical protein
MPRVGRRAAAAQTACGSHGRAGTERGWPAAVDWREFLAPAAWILGPGRLDFYVPSRLQARRSAHWTRVSCPSPRRHPAGAAVPGKTGLGFYRYQAAGDGDGVLGEHCSFSSLSGAAGPRGRSARQGRVGSGRVAFPLSCGLPLRLHGELSDRGLGRARKEQLPNSRTGSEMELGVPSSEAPAPCIHSLGLGSLARFGNWWGGEITDQRCLTLARPHGAQLLRCPVRFQRQIDRKLEERGTRQM